MTPIDGPLTTIDNLLLTVGGFTACGLRSNVDVLDQILHDMDQPVVTFECQHATIAETGQVVYGQNHTYQTLHKDEHDRFE